MTLSNRYLQAAEHIDKATDSLTEARQFAPGMISTESYKNAVGSLLEAVALLQKELEQRDALIIDLHHQLYQQDDIIENLMRGEG
jgi:hypothetical protein